jgi:hypothetical protein
MSDTDLSSVGDHFMIGLRPGVTLDDRDRALLGDLRPAGVILFKSNFNHDAPYDRWLESHAKLIDAIRQAAGRDRLFIAIDHEGGRVCRTPPPITRYSYAARWAATAEDVGEAMGRELSSLGVNLSFAPVLDIDSNPANPVIGERAFGRTPEQVISAAIPFMQGLERHGVRACGKHFPGHGDTKADSHSELPVLELSLEEIEVRELKPFAAAIGAGVGMIMTSHIMFTAIDRGEPRHAVAPVDLRSPALELRLRRRDRIGRYRDACHGWAAGRTGRRAAVHGCRQRHDDDLLALDRHRTRAQLRKSADRPMRSRLARRQRARRIAPARPVDAVEDAPASGAGARRRRLREGSPGRRAVQRRHRGSRLTIPGITDCS